jgi:hypothetical protein
MRRVKYDKLILKGNREGEDVDRLLFEKHERQQKRRKSCPFSAPKRSKFSVNLLTVSNPHNPYDQFRLCEGVDYAVNPNSITPERRLEIPLQLFALTGIMHKFCFDCFPDMFGSFTTEGLKIVFGSLFPEDGIFWHHFL